jgi:hypothetical protein
MFDAQTLFILSAVLLAIGIGCGVLARFIGRKF